MSFFNRLKSQPKANKTNQKALNSRGRGLIIFQVVEEAIMAEKQLKQANIGCKLLAPPPQLRKGCDLALEIDLIEQPAIERTLKEKVYFVGIFPLQGSAELLNHVKINYYGKYTMVKAGNMKLVFDSESGVIVNTSGGGCPDIPYLNLQMVGKKLNEAPRPREKGFTLCSLMLDRAFEEACALWEGGKK